MDWYYAEGKKQVGPFSEEAFHDLVAKGTITANTYVWCADMNGWERYGKVEGGAAVQPAAEGVPASAAAYCSECGKSFPSAELAQFGNARVCAGCKPMFVQKIREGVAVDASVEYAGFWIRLGAKAIDWLIMWVLQMVIYMPAAFFIMPGMMAGAEQNPDDIGRLAIINLLLSLLQMAISFGYSTWFVGKFGATPGKMACKLRVVTAEGGKVTYLRALGRAFAEIISSIILLIGYIMAAFDDQKRTLHDRICSTRVIRK